MTDKLGNPHDDSLRWFYESKGGYVGPITADALRDLLLDGSLSHDTLVWNETFGQFWKPIRETEIGIDVERPPPLLPQAPSRKRYWAIAAVLNLLGYGGGYLYVGRPKRALERIPVKLIHNLIRSFPRKRESRGHLLRVLCLLPLGPRFRGDERRQNNRFHLIETRSNCRSHHHPFLGHFVGLVRRLVG